MIACTLALGLAAVAHAAPAASTKSEYQIKAVFLLNFTRFVEWPPKVFAQPDAPLVIGVLGEDPFGSYLDGVVRHEIIDHHPVVVQRFRDVHDIHTCHVLFISRSETDRLDEILGELKGRDILTVSDADKFAVNGGMIGFVNRDRKVRLQINLEVAKDSSLAISSKLLRPSEIIGNWRKGSLPWLELTPLPRDGHSPEWDDAPELVAKRFPRRAPHVRVLSHTHRAGSISGG